LLFFALICRSEHNRLMRRKFWKRPALASLACLVVATLLGLWAFTHRSAEPAVVSAAFFVGAWIAAAQAWRRWLGVFTEGRAFKQLGLPSGWHASHGAASPAGGDIDILVTAPDERRFAIEVKSKISITTRRTWAGMGPRVLCDSRGRTVAPDDLHQAIVNAQAVGAEPVLWYPRASSATNTAQVGGCTVVFGGPRKLRRAIGAGGWLW
jgi:hypothetical protein